MTRSWVVAKGAAPIVRIWGEECVVHHALSNDTYRLTAAAGRMLMAVAGGTDDASDPGTRMTAPDDAEANEVLQVLTRLALVEQC